MRHKVALLGAFLALAAGVVLGVAGCAVPVLSRPRDLTRSVDRVEAAINSALLQQGVALAEVRTGVRTETRLSHSLNARWTYRSYTLVAYPTFRNLEPADYAAGVREGIRRAGAQVNETRELPVLGVPKVFRFAVQVPVRVGDQRLIIDALDISVIPPGAIPEGEGTSGEEDEAEAEEPAGPPKVALIIDDWGYEQSFAPDFFSLPVPLTMAVIPFLPASERWAREGHDHGWEVLVHLPMQPESPRMEGKADLKVTMTNKELRQAVREALAAIPFAVGANNHKGSRATQDRRVMGVVLDEVAAHRLFFVDSRTSVASVAGEVAREQRLPHGENLLFLDGRSDVDYVRQMLRALVQAAGENGYAIGIGHVRKETLVALQEELPALLRQGVVFVPVKQLARRNFQYRSRVVARPVTPARPPAPVPPPEPAPPEVEPSPPMSPPVEEAPRE